MPQFRHLGLGALLLAVLLAGIALAGGCTRSQDETPPADPDSPPPAPPSPDSIPAPKPADDDPPTLRERLLRARLAQEDQASPDLLSAYTLGFQEIAGSGVPNEALNVGDKAPDFSLSDHRGETFRLSDALKNGPVVLLWYLGRWNGYCRHTLMAFQNYYQDFRHHSGQLVAISPDPPEITAETAEHLKLDFPLLSDPEHKVARAFGSLAPLPGHLRELWEAPEPPDERPQPIPAALPLTAVYVVDRDGLIHHAVLNADWRLRGEAAEVMQILHRLKHSAPQESP